MYFKTLFIIGTLLVLNFSIPISGQKSSWRLQDIKEVKCSDENPLPRPENEEMRPVLWKLIKEVKYYPYMNKLTMHGASMASRGKGISSDEEIKEACIVRKAQRSSTPQHLKLTIKEFGNEVEKTCDATDFNNIHCDIEDNGEMEEVHYLRRYASIIWSDWKENLLFLICYENNLLGWHVKSKKKEISPQTQKAVLREIKKLGFSARKAIEVSYDECS